MSFQLYDDIFVLFFGHAVQFLHIFDEVNGAGCDGKGRVSDAVLRRI